MKAIIMSVSLAAAAVAIPASAQAVGQNYNLNIPRQSLDAALKDFANQTGLQVARLAGTAGDSTVVGPLAGELSAQDALKSLLTPSGLTYKIINDKTIAIVDPAASTGPRNRVSPSQASDADEKKPFWRRFNLAQSNAQTIESKKSDLSADQADIKTAEPPASSRSAVAGAQKTPTREDTSIPEVLVKGSRILNMDIRRTRDDAQPYVIFERETIERSGAVDLGDFLKRRLTMNTVGVTQGQGGTSASGAMSTVNLRGLGSNQTLILIDGRRVASSAATGNSLNQPDLNGIPLMTVERIEVLPNTASGIYGGAATGGAVNIIMRRDYSGAVAKVTYDNSFEGNSSIRRIDVGAGYNLPDGKTNITFAGAYAEQDPLSVGDRDFVQRGRNRVFANNPGFFTTAATPPLGATPNIRSVSGAPLFGPGTPNFTSVPVGYTGGGGLAAFQPRAGQYNFDLANSAQTFGRGGTLLNGPTVEAGTLTVRRSFAANLDVFVEAAVANNIGHSPATLASGSFTVPAGATNPFGQAVRVTVPVLQSDGVLISDNRSQRLAAGVIVKLPGDWSAEADYTWNKSRNHSSVPFGTAASATAAVTSGALDILRDPNAVLVDFGPYVNPPLISGPYRTTLKNATLRAAGPVGALPAGPITVSALIERRDETLDAGYQLIPPNLTFLFPERSQTIDSGYLETKLPLISPAMGIPAIRELELQLAGRWDDYAVESSTASILNPTPTSPVVRLTNRNDSLSPTFGLRYLPVQDLMLRGSYGKGFLPPAVNQLVPGAPSFTATTVIDPRRPGTTTSVPAGQIFTGGNAQVQPEESESWSAGIVLTPRWVTGLRLSLDYTKIEKSDEIRNLVFQQIVDIEAFLPAGRVIRAAPSTDPLFGVGEITAIDATTINISSSRIEAYDLAIDYDRIAVAGGNLGVFAQATWQPHYLTRLLPTNPEVENAGVSTNNPLKFKAAAGLTWERNRVTLGWTARYFNSYLVADPSLPASAVIILNQGSQRVSSQTYHDFSSSYRWDSGILDGIETRFGVRNVFDKEPPFDAGSISTHYYSYYGDPRLRSYYLSVQKDF